MFTQKCPNCSKPVDRDAQFCPNCGERLSGGTIKCASCNAENPGDSIFCKNCGQKLVATEAPKMSDNRWVRKSGEMAVKVEHRDLKGLFRRGVNIEAGTRALLFIGGANIGELHPGYHDWDSLGDKLQGKVSAALVTVVLTDASDFDLRYQLPKIITQDDFEVAVDLNFVLRLQDPNLFFENVMRGQPRVSVQALGDRYQAELTDAVNEKLANLALADLDHSFALKGDITVEIEHHLRHSLQNDGIELLRISSFRWSNPELDRLSGDARAERIAHLSREAIAQRERARRMEHLENELKDLTIEDKEWEAEIRQIISRLAQARQKRQVFGENDLKVLEWEKEHALEMLKMQVDVEDRTQPMRERRRRQLEAMRKSLNAAKQAEIIDNLDMEKFVRQMTNESRKHQLFSDEEMADILVDLKKKQVDREARLREVMFFDKKLQLQQEHEVRLQELEQRHGVTMTSMDQLHAEKLLDLRQEIVRLEERKKSEWNLRRREVEHDLELKRLESVFKREEENERRENERINRSKDRIADLEVQLREAKTAEEKRRIQIKLDEEEGQMGLRLLEQVKAVRRRDIAQTKYNEFRDYQRRVKLDMDRRLQEWEFRSKERDEERKHELERLKLEKDKELERIRALDGASEAAIFASTGSDPGKNLTEWKKLETAKLLDAEQLYALDPSKITPQVAEALKAKWGAATSEEAVRKERESLMERLKDRDRHLEELKAQEERAAREREAQRNEVIKQGEKSWDSATKMVDSLAGKNSAPNPTIVVTGQGQSQTVAGAAGPGAQPSGSRVCPHCGLTIERLYKFCPFCGKEIPGAN